MRSVFFANIPKKQKSLQYVHDAFMIRCWLITEGSRQSYKAAVRLYIHKEYGEFYRHQADNRIIAVWD